MSVLSVKCMLDKKNRLLQQTVIQIRKNSGEGSKILKPLPQNPYAKNWEFFCFANALPVLKKSKEPARDAIFLHRARLFLISLIFMTTTPSKFHAAFPCALPQTALCCREEKKNACCISASMQQAQRKDRPFHLRHVHVAAEAAMLAVPALCMYTLYQFGAAYNFQAPGWPLVGKTTKLQTKTQYSCGVRSLISIIMRLWLLCLSPSYTSFQHFNVSVREICHCVLPQNEINIFHNSNSDKNGAPLQGAAIIMHSLLKPHQNIYATFTLPPMPRCLPPYPYRLTSTCHGSSWWRSSSCRSRPGRYCP